MFGRRTRLAALGAVSLGACAVLAACSPVKMGAAAVVGDQRISVASLDTQVTNLQTAAKPFGTQVQLPADQMPAAVLSWLIRFQVEDEVASSHGITVSATQVQQGVESIRSQAQQAATQNGLSNPQVVLLSAGISPQMLPMIGRYQAQQIAYAEKVNGGRLPTTSAENDTVNAALTKAQCTAAKSLNIQVSPQFGRLDYSQFAIVPAADTLSRPAGPPSPAPTTGLVPAC
ncbi:MAG TPA: SurA N-terminal domain-containing protein [Trebonia sp.]